MKTPEPASPKHELHAVPVGGRVEHVALPNCWCEPEQAYVDRESGMKVYVHQERPGSH